MTTRHTWASAIALSLVLPGLAHAAASPLADAARLQDRAAIRAMLKQKGDVNAPQPDGATALHWATHWDDAETVEMLLSAGAAVNAKNDYGVTPLALASENANLIVVQRLIKAGADVIVVRLFAVFHDAERTNEGYDPEHGQRGADLAARLHGDLFKLTDGQLALLLDACRHHNDGLVSCEITVGTCWDADRLDLPRVGLEPQADKMSTPQAKQLVELRHSSR